MGLDTPHCTKAGEDTRAGLPRGWKKIISGTICICILAHLHLHPGHKVIKWSDSPGDTSAHFLH